MNIAVAVLDFGGPQGPAELVPFLTQLLEDVLPGPMALRRLAAPMIASRRSKIVGPNYASIGWSPLVKTHHAQIAALRAELGGDAAPPIVSGMMFTPPTMAEAADALAALKPDAIVAIAMFPHFSIATTNTAFSFFWAALKQRGLDQLPVRWVPAWFDHPDYLEALAATIREGVARTPGPAEEPVHLLFTPHGLPLSFVRRGDPYPDQIRESVRSVIHHLVWDGPWHLGWQSRVGPVQWLTPSTPEMLDRLAASGVRRVCMVPISFASEHIETLYEIDVEYRDHARHVGIEHFGRAPSLGLQPGLIRCLADRIRDALKDRSRLPCVRCLAPKDDVWRAQRQCPNCRFSLPDYLRSSKRVASVAEHLPSEAKPA